MKYQNPYTQKEYEAKQELVKELNALDTSYTFELVDDPTNDGRDYVALKSSTPIHIGYHEYYKTYSLYLNHQLPFIQYAGEPVSEKYTKPNEIHKLHKNKIIAWVEYLTKIYDELVILSAERTKKVNEFEAQMEKLGAKFNKRDEHDYTFSGMVIKNGIKFEFSVSNSGYIYKKIALHYSVEDTIDNFLALADNKYTTK